MTELVYHTVPVREWIPSRHIEQLPESVGSHCRHLTLKEHQMRYQLQRVEEHPCRKHPPSQNDCKETDRPYQPYNPSTDPPQPICINLLDLSEEFSLQLASKSDLKTIFTLEKISAPKVDFKRIVNISVRDPLWVFEINLNVYLATIIVDETPCEI